MADSDVDSRFTFSVISKYLESGGYPDDYSKADKLAFKKAIQIFLVLEMAVCTMLVEVSVNGLVAYIIITYYCNISLFR